jgi:hypothetical protein
MNSPSISLLLLSCLVSSAAPWSDLADFTGKDDAGETVHHALPVDPGLRNPWPVEWEREFQQRARGIIAAQAEVGANAGNTYFENEKRTYGYLMAQGIGGRGMAAVRELQVEDAQREAWHRHTEGIDYYACFTLKHQMRKYFLFGGLLEPDYRRRMFDGAKSWTEKDPLKRPHEAYQGPKEGWGPDARNSWVDVRTTENLYLMRVTSVYLMAEETGNRETAALYKEHLLGYARTLYRVGMGEWDSENYHGHSLAPLLNLHDFARDPEVRAVAKSCLDFMAAAGAVKYRRGAFNGPTKRDYNHPQPFGGSAAAMLWVWFGDSPRANHSWESDEVHLITSGYRPPAAVVKLARKEMVVPVEVHAAKPSYGATTGQQADGKPEFLETQYFGHSFQMGSLIGGTSEDGGDVNGFKILVDDSRHGARALHGVPGPDPAFAGSPRYEKGKVSAANRVAQHGNLALWLVKDGSSPWLWVVPDGVRLSDRDGVALLECERTWVALRPLGATPFRRDDALTAKVGAGEHPSFPGHQVLAAQGGGGAYCGVLVEVGEKESHGSFAAFAEAVAKGRADVSKLAGGVVRYRAADGKELGIEWHDDPLQLVVWRDGERRDLAADAGFLYRSTPGGPAPVHAKWGGGSIYVEAGGEAFGGAVDDAGRATFAHGSPAAVRPRFVR